MSAAERITVEDVVENAKDYADERSTTVEWIIENAEDVADEENARVTVSPASDPRPMLILERADLEQAINNPWVGVAPLDLNCATCGGYGRHPIQLQSDGLFGSKGKCLDCSDGQIELPAGLATMLLADTTGRIHGTWTGRLLPMVDVTPDPPSAPHIYIRPGDNAVYIWNHPHPLAYMPSESLTGTWAPGAHAVHTVKFERRIDDLGIPSGYPTSYPDPGQQAAPCITTINLGGNPVTTATTVDDELVAQILAALPPIKHDPIPDRGFMLQGAENAYADIGRLVEDAAWTLLERGDSDATVVIEAYTIRQRRSHLPHADDLCVYLEECAADNEACENVEYGRSPAVLALAEALAQRMSNEGNGWMCDEQTATHIVTLAGRQPILDGEPWGEPLPDPDGSACHEAFPCDDCVRERLQ